MYDTLTPHLNDNTGAYIRSLTTGKVYLAHNEAKRFRSASVIKLFILVRALETKCENDIVPCANTLKGSEIAELGETSASADRLLYMMIGSSDNGATNALIDYLGFDEINASARRVTGSDTTALGRKMLDYEAIAKGIDNYTTPRDAFLATERIFALGGERYFASAKCLDRLMRYIYTDCAFYGKAGDMQGAVHDTGVLEACGGRVFASFMSEGYADAVQACGQAGLIALGILRSEGQGI